MAVFVEMLFFFMVAPLCIALAGITFCTLLASVTECVLLLADLEAVVQSKVIGVAALLQSSCGRCERATRPPWSHISRKQQQPQPCLSCHLPLLQQLEPVLCFLSTYAKNRDDDNASPCEAELFRSPAHLFRLSNSGGGEAQKPTSLRRP